MKRRMLLLMACGALLCAEEVAKEKASVDPAKDTVVEEKVEVQAAPERVVATVTPKKNMVRSKTNWIVQIDEFGSTVDTGTALSSGGMVSASFTMAPLANDEDWPYVEMICELGGSIDGFETIEITYECGTELLLKLLQTDMSDEGDESYAYYEHVLPAAKWMHTEKVAINDFIQPDWTPDKAKTTPLVRSHVTGLQIAPDIDEIIGGSATVKIKKLIFYTTK